ncbi:helix-turn-helix domain-containing protein, partial [Psychrobacter vallis]
MRYNLDFKLKIIAYYRQGHTGVATAKKFKLDKKIVSKWIYQY